MDAHKQAYREEAYELLAELEDALIELEQNPDNKDLINRIFRAMHTIKGSGAMFGFDDIAGFTHTIETVYDHIREDRLAVTEDLVSLTLSSCDQIKAMLDASQDQEEADPSTTRELTASFTKMLPAEDEPETINEGDELEPEQDIPDREVTYRIRFIPHPDLFENGTNPIHLLKEIQEFGPNKTICHLKDLPDLKKINPEACYASWDIILTTTRDINDIRDVFIFVEDTSDIRIDIIDDTSLKDDGYKRVGEILIDRGDISLTELENLLGKQKRIGEILIDSGKVPKSEVESALIEQDHVRNMRKKRKSNSDVTSIRVASNKLDSLVDLVGELVTVQARLTQTATQKNDQDFVTIAEEVERLTAELRDNAMGIRMLPIGTTFAKFKRLVRDLSTELGKEIDFTTEGEDTELDKTVIEKLSEPLVHLIRNSIDHGIELPDERRSTGKQSQGTIHLKAEHSGAYVLISIHDDGKGLDQETIRKKAIDKGLISTDAGLTEKEIFDLILAPGFSTSENVTSISGRGVGMDVVTKGIESFGGSVEISSTKGKGSTITLKLPLTLAIIDGLLVTIDEDFFVIPLGSVVECIELTEKEKQLSHNRNIINVRDKIVPYICLRDVFSIKSTEPGIEQIVITETGEKKVGFVVDKVIGKYQTVIKNMGKLYRNIEGISGASIMGDGNVALIMDINKLSQRAEVSRQH